MALAHHGLLRLEWTERGRARYGVAEGERGRGRDRGRREDRAQTAPLFQSKMETGTRNPREWRVARTQAFLTCNELIPFKKGDEVIIRGVW